MASPENLRGPHNHDRPVRWSDPNVSVEVLKRVLYQRGIHLENCQRIELEIALIASDEDIRSSYKDQQQVMAKMIKDLQHPELSENKAHQKNLKSIILQLSKTGSTISSKEQITKAHEKHTRISAEIRANYDQQIALFQKDWKQSKTLRLEKESGLKRVVDELYVELDVASLYRQLERSIERERTEFVPKGPSLDSETVWHEKATTAHVSNNSNCPGAKKDPLRLTRSLACIWCRIRHVVHLT